MSTILRALEKKSHSPHATIEDNIPASGWKLMVIIILLAIVVLLATVVFLLFKPAPEASRPIPLEPSYTRPLVNDYELEEENSHQVSEVDFKTKPLPISEEAEQIWVSPEVLTKAAPLTIATEKETSVKPVVITKANETTPEDFGLDDVSEDLQQRFASAVEFESSNDEEPSEVVSKKTIAQSDISQMPVTFQFKVPLMTYDSHMYSTKVEDRWIRINGSDLREGENIGGVELLEISPQKSVFRLGQQKFTLESLQDWKG